MRLSRFVRVCALALVGAVCPLVQAGTLSWSFSDGLEGWQPANWERLEPTPEGLRGVTRYDAQLLSPKLDIRAEDYPVMLVLLRTDRGGAGETFFAGPGQGLSDDRKGTHAITAGPDLRLYRIDLRQAKGPWSGPIERLRFDPLNAAGADVTISMITLLSDPDAMLLNGDAEILRDGMPFQWTSAGTAGRALVTDDRPASGLRALRVEAGGAWETTAVDLSFLGTFRVSGKARGSGCALSVRYTGATGPLEESATFPVAAGPEWLPFTVEFAVPDRAFEMRLCFVQGEAGRTDLDDIRVDRLRLGDIRQPPPPKPTWRAAWIWHPDLVARDHHRAWFRYSFDLPDGAVREAHLQITADDGYRACLNGTELGVTLGEMDGWRTPEVIDARAPLRPGRNDLTVEAEDVGSAQGLIAELAVVFEDGREFRVGTDRQWQAAAAPQGPWIAAGELGRVPCQPWGDLVYRPMGTLGRVRISLDSRPRTVRVGGRLLVDVEAVATARLPQPVAAKVLLCRDGKVLQESWAPRLLFAGGETAGARARLTDVGIDVPVSAGAGRAEVSLELLGAEAAEAVRARGVSLRSDRRTYEFPRAAVRVRGGVPRFVVEGDEVDPTQNLFTSPDDLQQRHGVESTIAIWTLGLEELGWYETGYDYSKVDRTLAQYFTANPRAWMLLTFTLDTRYHSWWLKQHPEAMCQMEGGETVIGDYHGGRRQLPSYGSPVWREAYSDVVRNLIRHLRQTPYAERIIGFHPCSGISWEWFHWGSQSGELVDYSQAGQADFRRWLRERYGTDDVLRQAWGQGGDLSLASAQVPAGERRRGPAQGLFFDPGTQRDVLDYNAYQHDVVADTILHFARLVKEETGGRSLFGTYYGYVTHLPESPGFCQGSGHFRLQRLLDAPEIDYLMAPVAYAWREVGGTAATMTAAGAFPLHGKLFYNQADLRTHWSQQAGHGKPDTVRGSIACMRRELARNLAEGSAIQWYDFSLGWTFGDRRLTDEAKRLYEAGLVRLKTSDWPPEDYLLVVVDERQMGTFDPFRPPYGLELIYRQREHLTRAGVPYRTVLWSDLRTYPELLRHRAMVLLNLFRLDDAELAFLQEHVLRDGRTVAIVGPVGLVGPQGPDVARTARVLGRPMVLGPESLPLQAVFAKELDGPWAQAAGLTVGVNTPFAPCVVPQSTDNARVLASFTTGGGPAALCDERDECRLFWSAVPGLPPPVLRAVAETAGVPVLCRSDDAIFAGHGFVGIHAATVGEKRVRLPHPGRVTDLISGRRWPAGTTEVSLPMAAGDTAILRVQGRQW